MAIATSGVFEVDPISRIEGHLGVKLTVTAGEVSRADVHGNLWRGFENFLLGREPNDAITFTQRICGVCPIPHGQTATFAADAVHGYSTGMQTWVTSDGGASGMWGGPTGMGTPEPTPAGYGIPHKAVLIRNLVLSAEFLMSAITHSYHLAAPSYVQGPAIPPWTPYFDNVYYHDLLESGGAKLPSVGADGTYSANLWSAVIKSYVKALRIRRLTFEAGALFAGRMPMTSCYVAGGVTNDNAANLATKCQKYRDMMAEIGTFIIREFVPIFLSLGALYPAYDNPGNGAGRLGYGAGCGNFLAWGGFPQKDGTLAMARGYLLKAGAEQVPASGASTITSGDVLVNLREHIKYSRYVASQTLSRTGDTLASGVTDPASEDRTIPVRLDTSQYSWLKAPRWNGQPMEVGPLARLVVAGLYPVNQTNVRDSAGIVAGTLTFGQVYQTYVKTATQGTGLDPQMIDPDIAVALVRDGLAKLHVGASTVVDTSNIDTFTATQIGTAYYDADAVILDGAIGGLVSYIYNLKGGLSTMDRLRGRALEAAVLVVRMIGLYSKNGSGLTWPAMGGWIGELNSATGATYIAKATPSALTFGIGAAEAPRGALMHMSTIEGGVIKAYQCIVPTTWNACPKDAGDVSGPMEQAMLGIPYEQAGASFETVGGITKPTGAGVEALRVAQSFDPCIACAVH